MNIWRNHAKISRYIDTNKTIVLFPNGHQNLHKLNTPNLNETYFLTIGPSKCLILWVPLNIWDQAIKYNASKKIKIKQSNIKL